MMGSARTWCLLCLVALLMCLRSHGQSPAAGVRVEPSVAAGQAYVDVTFSGAVDAAAVSGVTAGTAAVSGVTAGTAPGTGDWSPLEVQSVGGLGGRPRMVRVLLAGEPPAGHTLMRVCVGEAILDGVMARELCGEAPFQRDAAAELARIVAGLQTLPKSADERSLLASIFFGQAAGQTVGAADLSLVRGDLGSNDLNYFLRLKRGSAAGMDPRNLEAGARWRTNILMHGAARRRMAGLTSQGGARNLAEAATIAESLQQKWFAGHIVDVGVKLEGDAAGEKQWLGVVDAGWGLQSTTRRVSLPGAPGWFRFRWLAGGVEAGRDQARVKMGADAALLMRARGGAAPIHRLELEARSIARWLAKPELGERGLRPWTQVDAKAFFLESGRLRYGVRLSVQRGSLPPVYARVKSVQFGFVVESADDAK